MKNWTKGLLLVLMASIALWPVASVAGSSARIIPTGKVSLLQDGKPIQQIGSEMPLPDGVMMLCKGQCLVRAAGLQLVAKNDAVFGVAEGTKKWAVTVKSGRVDFTLASSAKLITFYTPHDVIDMQDAVFAASSNGVVRGTIAVTDKDTHFNITQGTARVSTENGTKVLKDGAEVRSTQAQIVSGGGGGVLGGGASGGLIAGGAGALAIGGGALAADNAGTAGKKQESQSTPTNLQ